MFLGCGLVPLAWSVPSTLHLSGGAPLRLRELKTDCRVEAETLSGTRLRCGQRRPYVQLLVKRRAGEDAAVLKFQEDGRKDSRLYRCRLEKEADRTIKGGTCEEIANRQPGNPNELVSPILKSHPVLTMANSHYVLPVPYQEGPGLLMRGMAPRSDADFESLQKAGVKQVLMFKDEVRGDTTSEKQRLEEMGFPAEKIHHVPFPWKDYVDFRTPCLDTLQALRIIQNSLAAQEPIYFHCTVGEDRTGYLAALYRLLTEKTDRRTIFLEEMCERGYSSGDPAKPYDQVVQKIEKATTRLFLKMAFLKDRGELNWSRLDDGICAKDPWYDRRGFRGNRNYREKDYHCRPSTRYQAIAR